MDINRYIMHCLFSLNIFPQNISIEVSLKNMHCEFLSILVSENALYLDHAEPIQISSILQGSEIEELKTAGKLVSDRIVLTILLERLLLPEYRTGVIVDGFPRTKLQAECIKLLFDRMLKLRRRFDGTSHFVKFRRPKFHITVLYVDQEVSIERQLNRGKRAMEHNERVRKMGVGDLKVIRETDINADKAKERYVYFQEHIYASIQVEYLSIISVGVT